MFQHGPTGSEPNCREDKPQVPTVIKADPRDFLGDVGRMWGWYPVINQTMLGHGKITQN